MKRRTRAAIAVVAAALAGASWYLARPEARADDELVRVDRVVDGDTLVVDGGRRVRLIGVDAPETVHPTTPVECYGEQASAFVGELLPPATTVRLVTDVDPRDRFDRELAYVFRDRDGLLVNAELVRTGHAVARAYPPNIARQAELDALGDAARSARLGLWGACPT